MGILEVCPLASNDLILMADTSVRMFIPIQCAHDEENWVLTAGMLKKRRKKTLNIAKVVTGGWGGEVGVTLNK